jgi:hypothetical protein
MTQCEQADRIFMQRRPLGKHPVLVDMQVM